MPSTSFHPCPICSTPVPHWERYPQAICLTCAAKACDRQGRRLRFFNVAAGGGFAAVVADTQEAYPSHICYIEGVKCWADEARFGGIVIQLYDDSAL